MENEIMEISAEQLLADTIALIESINVPVKYALQIARPLSQAVDQLKMYAGALREPEEEKPEGGETDV